MIENRLDKAVCADLHNRQGLDAARRDISEQCIECRICVKQCAFLTQYGTPKKIADNWRSDDETSLAMPFACSLCSLCTVVCPENIDPNY